MKPNWHRLYVLAAIFSVIFAASLPIAAQRFEMMEGAGERGGIDRVTPDRMVPMDRIERVKPDLSVKDLTFDPRKPQVGDEVDVLAIISNKGLDDLGGVRVRFYSGRRQIGRDQFIRSIPANGRAEARVRFTVQGTRRQDIQVQVDPRNEIAESNERNNTKQKTLKVRAVAKAPLRLAPMEKAPLGRVARPDRRALARVSALSDLKIWRPTIDPPKPYVGDEVKVTAMVENTGPQDLPRVCVRFTLERKRIIDEDPCERIGAREKVPFKASFKAKAAGMQDIVVKVDPNQKIAEADERNNIKEKSINVRALAMAEQGRQLQGVDLRGRPARKRPRTVLGMQAKRPDLKGITKKQAKSRKSKRIDSRYLSKKQTVGKGPERVDTKSITKAKPIVLLGAHLLANLVCSVKTQNGIIWYEGKTIEVKVGNKGLSFVFDGDYQVGIRPAGTTSKTAWTWAKGIKLGPGDQKPVKLPWPPKQMVAVPQKKGIAEMHQIDPGIFDAQKGKGKKVEPQYEAVVDFENKVEEGTAGEKDNTCGPFKLMAKPKIFVPKPLPVTQVLDGTFKITGIKVQPSPDKIATVDIRVEANSKNTFSVGNFGHKTYGSAWAQFDVFHKVWKPTGGGHGDVVLKKQNGGLYSITGKGGSKPLLTAFSKGKVFPKGKNTFYLRFKVSPPIKAQGTTHDVDMPKGWVTDAGNICVNDYYPVLKVTLGMQTASGVKSDSLKQKLTNAKLNYVKEPGEINICTSNRDVNLDKKIP